MSESVAVLGGRGMLGSDLTEHLRREGYGVTVWDLPECDITRPAHLAEALTGVQVVVNCAAFTDVDGAEDAPEAAMAVNATAVGELGKLAAEKNMFVVHVSTDFVFDGQAGKPYLETDSPRPVGVYGDSKLRGEKALEQTGCSSAIVRVQWSYGRNGTNFVFKLLKRAKAGCDLKVVDDQIGAPTWTVDMAKAIRCLIRGRCKGLYHFANQGYASRFEVARFIAQQARLSNRIVPCSSSDFPMKAVRPRSSRFDTTLIQSVLDHPIPHWQDSLSSFLNLNDVVFRE